MICPSCNADIPIRSFALPPKFCPNCGAAFNGSSPATNPTPAIPPAAKPNNSGAMTGVFGVILLAIIYGGIQFGTGGSGGMPSVSLPGLGISTVDADDLKTKVRVGMSYDEVTSAIGAPEKKQELNNSQEIAGTTYKTDMQMWYYGGNALQVVFDEGKVSGINRY